MTELALFSLDPTVADRFDEFHAANPHVYDALVRLAREWVASTGQTKLGIATLFERVRWDLAIVTQAADFRLNNDYKPYFARLIMQREADLADMFTLRRSAADDAIGRAM